jgi:parvulin-like peptidyl-prolyl isomerase
MEHPAFRLRMLLAAFGLPILLAITALAQQSAPPPTPSSPAIALVEGRPITQDDFDRVAKPYFDRLRSEMKQGFTEDVKKLASHNVLDELIRREVLIVEAKRQNLAISEAETDRILKQDPFFYANGRFDQSKFIQYKLNPGTNYLQVLPRIRELALAGKLDSIVRGRLAPAPAAVRAEWSKRNDQVRFKFLPLTIRDVSLEPESSESDWSAYYAAHQDQFEKKPRVRIRYVALPIPPVGDPQRDSLVATVTARGRGIADSLTRGVPIDSLAGAPAGVQDTGPFDVPASALPNVGAVPEIVAVLERATTDTTLRVVGPGIGPEAVIVGVIAERQPKTLPPMREVLADVRRRADAEKRREHGDAEKRAWYDAHRDSYRRARAAITRLRLDESAVAVKTPGAKDVERWYAASGKSWLGLSGSDALPPLTASLRDSARTQMVAEMRSAAAERALRPVFEAWRAGRDVRALARTARANVETLSVFRGAPGDSNLSAALADSLFAAGVGSIEGPRRTGSQWMAWRVDAVDTTIVPAFEDVRSRVEQEFAQSKREHDEADGRAWYDSHRSDYKTKLKYVVDYIRVRIPPVDSVKIADSELRQSYEKNQSTYRDPEQVRARHILISTRGTGLTDAVARARADSLRRALVEGADFAQVAERFSDDPGSKVQGGDLGFFERGRMVQEFSDTSFALPIGRVSMPVKTAFGYHLIRVDEKKPEATKAFEQVREEIRRKIAQTRGDSTAMREAESMRRRILRGESAAVVGAAAGGVSTSTPFAATEPLPGVGSIPGLGQQLDSLRVGRWAGRAFKSPDAYLLLRLKEKIPAGLAEFTEARFQATEDAKNAKRKQLLAAKVAAMRGRLAAGASLDSLAAPYGGLKDSGPLNQSSPFVPLLGAEPRVVAKAFAMKTGQVSDTLATAQGFAWIQVAERKALVGSSFAKDRPAIVQELAQKSYEKWLEAKKKTVRIEILRADLREKPKPITQTFTVGG